MKSKTRIVIMTLLSIFCFSGCLSTEAKIEEPDIAQVRNICNLATLECYYHNVAKAVKPAGKGITHLGENDRKFWIEYTGIVRLGIDMSDVDMKVDGKNINISLPSAKVIKVLIDENSLGEDSYVLSKDGFNSNKVSVDDQTAAIKEAQEQMKETIMTNSNLLLDAQNRAKKLIGNYIEQLGKAQGVDYTINWKLDGIKANDKEENFESSTSN